MRERSNIFSGIDTTLFIIWLTLAIAGIFAIFSTTSGGDFSLFTSINGRHGKQIIFLGISLIAMLIMFTLDYQYIVQSSFLFYLFTIILLLLTLVIGAEINGSKSWIKLGSFQFQPAEFAKIGTSMFLAYWLAYQENVFRSFRNTSISIIIIAIPMVLILLQGDLGSMLTFLMLIFVLYREGLTGWPIIIGLAFIGISLTSLAFGSIIISASIVLICVIAMLYFRKHKGMYPGIIIIGVSAILLSFSIQTVFESVLKDYQKDRVLVLLGIKDDPHGAGYNLWQSKMAISSGRITGKGYLQGVQTQGDFIPEVSTDYIFANVGEEWGFLGSLFVIGMFGLLIFRILKLAELQKTNYSRVFMYSAACFFTIHVFINIGSVTGIFPTAGIPLPFFSSGGSSLFSFSMIIAIILRLNAERFYLLG